MGIQKINKRTKTLYVHCSCSNNTKAFIHNTQRRRAPITKKKETKKSTGLDLEIKVHTNICVSGSWLDPSGVKQNNEGLFST